MPGGTNGAISAFATDATDLILDINGYFAPPGSPDAMRFYPATPCRLLDTRSNNSPLRGTLALDLGSVAGCPIPAFAKVLSLNATVIPQTALGSLTLWPAGHLPAIGFDPERCRRIHPIQRGAR